MSRVTTLPYIDVEDESGVREDWFRLYCTLCNYRTSSGSFSNCEMDAAEHLDAEHPDERRKADEAAAEVWRSLQGQQD